MQALLDTIARLEPGREARRVFHGRGGLFPGCEQWTLDAYPPVWLLTSHRPTSADDLRTIDQALEQRWSHFESSQPLNWVYQERGAGKALTRLMRGSVPDPHVVVETGARYRVHILQGQNHGLFLDMAAGRALVRDMALARPGMSVLNLFAYTCAFSVVALQAGAGRVVNVDMSAAALSTGQHNHRLNGLEAGASFLAHDLFNSWGKLGRLGPYELVIVDPPSFQKGSFIATKDYARVIRRLPALLTPGGEALLCLNAPELGAEFLHDLVAQQAPELRFIQRIANPDVMADVSPDRALKVLRYRNGPD